MCGYGRSGNFFCALAQTPGGMLPSDELVGALLVAIDQFSSASWVSLTKEEIGRGPQVHYFFSISLGVNSTTMGKCFMREQRFILFV